MLDRKKMMLVVVITSAVSFLTGLLASHLGSEIEINYISQSELLELEKSRIKKQGLEERQLFFGKPEQAIRLIEQIQAKRQSRYKNNIIVRKSYIRQEGQIDCKRSAY